MLQGPKGCQIWLINLQQNGKENFARSLVRPHHHPLHMSIVPSFFHEIFSYDCVGQIAVDKEVRMQQIFWP